MNFCRFAGTKSVPPLRMEVRTLKLSEEHQALIIETSTAFCPHLACCFNFWHKFLELTFPGSQTQYVPSPGKWERCAHLLGVKANLNLTGTQNCSHKNHRTDKKDTYGVHSSAAVSHLHHKTTLQWEFVCYREINLYFSFYERTIEGHFGRAEGFVWINVVGTGLKPSISMREQELRDRNFNLSECGSILRLLSLQPAPSGNSQGQPSQGQLFSSVLVEESFWSESKPEMYRAVPSTRRTFLLGGVHLTHEHVKTIVSMGLPENRNCWGASHAQNFRIDSSIETHIAGLSHLMKWDGRRDRSSFTCLRRTDLQNCSHYFTRFLKHKLLVAGFSTISWDLEGIVLLCVTQHTSSNLWRIALLMTWSRRQWWNVL